MWACVKNGSKKVFPVLEDLELLKRWKTSDYVCFSVGSYDKWVYKIIEPESDFYHLFTPVKLI